MSSRLDFLKNRLNSYYEAEQAILSGQSYTIGKKTLERPDLAEVKKAIKDLESQAARAEGKGRRCRFVVPVDL